MLSQNEKDILAIMNEIGAEEGAIITTLFMLDRHNHEKEAKSEKLLKYILAKGKYITIQDILSKCTQICLPCEQYLPPNMYVKYIGETSEELETGICYQVIVSYNNDREFMIENDAGKEKAYPAELFETMEVSKIRYIGMEHDDGSIEITKGFIADAVYTVDGYTGRGYFCSNGLICPLYECEPVKFEHAKSKSVSPFRRQDGALKCLRLAFEFGRHSQLENHLAATCEYISQSANLEYHTGADILRHLKYVADYQLEHDIFVDCAYATVTKSVEGNRFHIGQRCMPFYIDGNLEAVAFVTETAGVINGIYILTEPYEFELDEP